MIKKYGKYVVLSLLVAAVAVSGVSAYFTATDTATNNFTVNKVDVELTEPNWPGVKVEPGDDGVTGTDDDVITEVPVVVTPNQAITKDPTVKNLGNVDQYVFVKVTVPYKNIVTAKPDGTKNAKAETDLFSWTVNTGWSLVQSDKIPAADGADYGVVEYIYAYGSATEMTALAANATTTTALFNSVTMCNAVDGADGGNLATTLVDIDVAVFAIQASDLGANDTKVPSEVLAIYLAQNAPAADQDPT